MHTKLAVIQAQSKHMLLFEWSPTPFYITRLIIH
jgi:hypothetical protein